MSTPDVEILRDESGKARALSFSSGSTEPVPNQYEAPAGVATPNRAILGAVPCASCGQPVNPKGRGKDPRRFCDARCRSAEYARMNPRLPLGQVHSRRRKQIGQTIREQILALMRDGKWWTVWQLAERVGCMETAASAKMRDLRKWAHGSHRIDGRRLPDSAAWEFRLVGADESK